MPPLDPVGRPQHRRHTPVPTGARPVAGILVALLLLAAPMSSHDGARDRHVLIVTPAADDARLAATREAIAFWNGTLAALQLDLRLLEVGVLIAPRITSQLERYTRQIWNLAGRPVPPGTSPPPPPELDALAADVVVFLSRQRIFSFAWPRAEGRKFFIGIQTDSVPPLSLPNVSRNVVAHEIGHVLGLQHSGPTRTIMCGPCDHLVYRSAQDEFLPLTPEERDRLRALHQSP